MRQTILMHPPPDGDPTSNYVEALARALGHVGVQVRGLGLRSLLAEPDAVVHVHWPEHLFGHPSPVKSVARLLRGVAIVGLAKQRRQPIVWTAHNIEPHGGWPLWSRRAARWMRASAAGVVVLCEGQAAELLDEFPELERAALITLPEGRLHDGPLHPLGDLADRPVRLLHLGVLIPYKRQLEVIEGLAPHLAAGQVELRIVGRSGGDAYSDQVESLASEHDGVEFIGRRVSEVELQHHVEWCDAAVGVQDPAFNTGIPAAFLPLGRRVVLSTSTQASFLQERLGQGWVVDLDDITSPAAWDSVLRRLRRPPKRQLDLEQFSWQTTADRFKCFCGSLTENRG